MSDRPSFNRYILGAAFWRSPSFCSTDTSGRSPPLILTDFDFD
ncbi:hypothetical protein P7L53_03520 [Thermoleptolyngbya sichuanensis XZ-Cy5]|nr:hypothetical protein [Thermoleptolyngbya sichuanensis]MDG2615304.1 hypothetical protein [Thermoleptolyngbya sichuanensis XZ-Cy5]